MCTPPRCGASLRRQKRVLHLEMELLAMVSCLVGEPDLNPVQEQKCSSPLSVSPGPVPCLPITKMSISPAEPASVETEWQREISGFQTFFFCSLENFYEEIKYTKPVRTKLWTFSVRTTGMVTSRKCPVAAGGVPLSSEGKEKTWVTGENSLILKLYWTLNWIFL